MESVFCCREIFGWRPSEVIMAEKVMKVDQYFLFVLEPAVILTPFFSLSMDAIWPAEYFQHYLLFQIYINSGFQLLIHFPPSYIFCNQFTCDRLDPTSSLNWYHHLCHSVSPGYFQIRHFSLTLSFLCNLIYIWFLTLSRTYERSQPK